MASSQPIALPAHHSATSAPFNPASYTRTFVGSPLSWRTHAPDIESRKLSSSIESHAFGVLDGEHCRNYTCCGLNLTDLHALLEHFEEVHVKVVDPLCQQLYPQLVGPGAQSQYSFQPPALQYPPAYSLEQPHGPFDPDDMELDLDTTPSTSTSPSSASSPPDTPISTPLSPNVYPNSYATSSLCISPISNVYLDQAPISAFDTTILQMPHRARPHPLSTFPPPRSSPTIVAAPDAFNAYAGYSDYSSSMPGTVPSPPTNIVDDRVSAHSKHSDASSSNSGCVPTALLFSSSPTPTNTPTTSRVPSPSQSQNITREHSSTPTSRASTTLSRPASSLLLNKPFRCPKPNCNKSYKQANGLKYHMTHGSCNFAPPKDLEQVQALLASKRSAARNRSSSPNSPNSPTAGPNSAGEANVDASNLGLGMITENELREVEKEAERRLRPFACGLGDCQRRYKNMNGLRYHYQHSGDHGSHGLALLAAGTHECLNALKAANASALNSPSAQSSPRISRQSSQDERKASTPVQAVNIPIQAQPYAQQQPYGGFSVQQAQITYQQQQYAQQQRAQYQAQAQQVQNMGMYIGMEFAG